jgi:hypothetical protein
MPEAIPIPRVIPADAAARLARLRKLAWILDRSFGIGSTARFGVDPVLGLIPVVGDWLGAVISLYAAYEAIRLGIPWHVVGRILANTLVDLLVGAIPVLGDVFDFVWQSNARNAALVERYYHPRLTPRSNASIVAFFTLVVVVVIASAVAIAWAAVVLLKQLVALF